MIMCECVSNSNESKCFPNVPRAHRRLCAQVAEGAGHRLGNQSWNLYTLDRSNTTVSQLHQQELATAKPALVSFKDICLAASSSNAQLLFIQGMLKF